MLRVVCISDTHAMEDELEMPDGDLLLHAGDITNKGEYDQLEKFNNWLENLDYERKICIPGNHDRTIPKYPEASEILTNCDLLIDSFTSFRGFKIYGSPWTPWFGGHYWVYNRKRGLSINDAWIKIPEDTDILITHGPPYGILDSVPRVNEGQGCKDLLRAVRKIKPRLHVYGHLHLQGGQQKHMFGSNTTFVNASVCTEDYEPINPIVVVELESKGS